jgi:hypothetical protein
VLLVKANISEKHTASIFRAEMISWDWRDQKKKICMWLELMSEGKRPTGTCEED